MPQFVAKCLDSRWMEKIAETDSNSDIQLLCALCLTNNRCPEASSTENLASHRKMWYKVVMLNSGLSYVDLFLDQFPDYHSFVARLQRHTHMGLIQNDQLPTDALLQLWDLTKSLLEALADAGLNTTADDPESRWAAKTLESWDTCWVKTYIAMAQHRANRAQEKSLKRKFDSIVGSLPVRALHWVESQGFDHWSVLEGYKNLRRTVGDDTSRAQIRFQNFLEAFQNYQQEIEAVLAKSPIELECEELIEQFPFLTMQEAEKVWAFREEHGHLPRVHLLRLFLTSDTSRNASIYRRCKGIDIPHETLDNIAETENLTRERARQISIAYPKGEAIQALLNVLGPEDALPPIITTGQLVARVRDKETDFLENANDNTVIALALILDKSLETRVVNDTPIIINHAWDDKVNFDPLLEPLITAVQNISTDDSQLDLKQLIVKNINLERYVETTSIFNTLSLAISQWARVEMGSDGVLTVAKNRIDIEQEIYRILADNGPRYMSFQEIIDEFKRRYPEATYKPATIRATIHTSPRIAAQGRNSIYYLPEWGIKPTSFVDECRIMLQESDIPLSCQEMAERLIAKGRPTTATSLYTFCTVHSQGFVHFGNQLMGLADKEYPPEYKEQLRYEKKILPFEETFATLRSYIDQHGHLPESQGDTRSLYNWIKNISNGRNNLPEEQMAAFEAYKAQNIDRWITAADFEFRNMATQALEIVTRDGLSALSRYHKQLYIWYKANKQRFENMTDFRKQCFKPILDALHPFSPQLPF